MLWCRHMSYTVGLVRFKFLCNILIIGKSIKETLGSVASGTHCIGHTVLLTACCSQTISKPVWHIPLLCVQWKTPDDGQRYCPKHVEFYAKIKFENLMHLVSFIIRIYHDARSPECQKKTKLTIWATGLTMDWPTPVMGKLFKEGAKGKEKNFRRANIIY